MLPAVSTTPERTMNEGVSGNMFVSYKVLNKEIPPF